MQLYTNTTRFNAIVTIKVGPGNDKAITIGPSGAHSPQKVLAGHNDVLVPGGTSLEIEDGVDIVFISVRSSS